VGLAVVDGTSRTSAVGRTLHSAGAPRRFCWLDLLIVRRFADRLENDLVRTTRDRSGRRLFRMAFRASNLRRCVTEPGSAPSRRDSRSSAFTAARLPQLGAYRDATPTALRLPRRDFRSPAFAAPRLLQLSAYRNATSAARHLPRRGSYSSALTATRLPQLAIYRDAAPTARPEARRRRYGPYRSQPHRWATLPAPERARPLSSAPCSGRSGQARSWPLFLCHAGI
jgi:hypothetical protein